MATRTFENKQHGVKMTVTDTEFFGNQIKISANGILGYEGQATIPMIKKTIEQLGLIEVK